MSQVGQIMPYNTAQMIPIGGMQEYPSQVSYLTDQVNLTREHKPGNLSHALMSLIIPGSGQIADGNTRRGRGYLILAGILDSIALFAYTKARSMAKETPKAVVEDFIYNKSIDKLLDHVSEISLLTEFAVALAGCVHVFSALDAYRGRKNPVREDQLRQRQF